jgi:hypothetical protein
MLNGTCPLGCKICSHDEDKNGSVKKISSLMLKQNKLERFPSQVFSGHANIPGYIIKDMLTQQDLVAK